MTLNAKDLTDLLAAVEVELVAAVARYGDFASLHEGYAVLLEEADELFDEIKVKSADRDLKKVRAEALQVAAMALKLAHKAQLGSV